MKEIKDIKTFNEIATQDKPVLLDFYAEWCGPCRTLLPTVEKLANKYEDDFIIRKVNVDNLPALAQKFNVRSIPALFVLKDQEIKEKMVGLQTEHALEKVIQKHIVAVA